MRLQLSSAPTRARTRRIWPYALVLGVALLVQLVVLLNIRLSAAGASGGDLCRDAIAAQRVLAHQNPYLPITTCGMLFDLPHPPAYLLLIGPFALLPFVWAGIVWDLLMLAALIVSLGLIGYELRLAPAPWYLAVLLGLLIFWPPLLGTLLEAQVSPLLLLLLALAWRWTRHGHTGRAGIALGIAGAIRLFPLLAVAYFLLRREWRAVFAAGATFVVAEALPLPIIGVNGYVDYATREAPRASAQWIGHEHNVSAWGLAHMIFTGNQVARAVTYRPQLVSPLALTLLAIMLGALAIRTFQRRRLSFAADQATFLAYIPAMLLASPLTWEHYFVLLLLPILVLGAAVGLIPATPSSTSSASSASSPAKPQRGWLRSLLLVALALLWINALIVQFVPLGIHSPTAVNLFILALPGYALILLFIALLLPTPQPENTLVPSVAPAS